MRRPSAAAAPLDDVFLLEEILLRLTPQPSSLPRASLVCTRWRRLLSDTAFLRRFRKHHHRRNEPLPLLGFFDKEFRADDPPIFNATTTGQRDRISAARFSSPWTRGEGWLFLGCRHGLALLISRKRREAVVWDPLTGHQRRVAFPPGFSKEQGRYVHNAAVMCAAAATAQDGHLHGDCRFTPFRLALVGGGSDRTRQFACLYQSESGLWGDIVSVQTTQLIFTSSHSVLVRDAFCWLLSEGGILVFDFQNQSLVVTEKPAGAHAAARNYWSFFVVRTEHGGLGLAILTESQWRCDSIRLWEMKSNCDGGLEWELQKTIQLSNLFSQEPAWVLCSVMMQGYDEDTNAIILSTFLGDYMLQLESMQLVNLVKIRRSRLSIRIYYPYRNFYITGSKNGGAGV